MARVLPRDFLDDVRHIQTLQNSNLDRLEIPRASSKYSNGNRLKRLIEMVAVIVTVDDAF